MARFLKIPAVVTDPDAGTTAWSLGTTGFNHRWDATLLTDPVGSTILTLPDKIGTLDLVANNSGTKTLTATAAFNYLAISSGSTLGYKPSPDGTAGFTNNFTAVFVVKSPAGAAAVFGKVGGYAFEFGGNGKLNAYSYGATTTQLATVSNGTGWHIVVASLSGATSKIMVDGVDYSNASWPTPVNMQNLYFGGGTNAIDGALFATHPAALGDADRLAVHNAIKAQLGL